jgi:peptide/nickel transport system permease protein
MSFLQSWKKTARLYVKSKIGMIGLIVIVFFILLAVFSAQLAPNNPVTDFDVAAPYSVPAWATIFPQYSNLAITSNPIETVFANPAALAGWTTSGQNFTTRNVNGTLLVNASIVPNQKIMNDNLKGHPDNKNLPGGQVFFSMSKQFQYNTKPPTAFTLNTVITPLEMTNVSDIYVNFIISNPTGNYSLASVQGYTLSSEIDIPSSELGQPTMVNVSSGYLTSSGLSAFGNTGDPAGLIFNGTGTYTLTMQIQAVPIANGSSISMLASGVNLHVLGGAFGLLGTDNYGRDVWSQFVWGSRISLLIGILSGIGAVALGTIAGLAAGYVGGLSDEVLSRISDFFLVIPFLPLLIVLLFIIGQNPVLYRGVYWWVILLFIVLSWPFIGKIIRSQVLTVKERSYVEASRAVGGGTWHILRKHILPNVMGLVYSQIALNVSGFILTEAALDFLAVSIHPIDTITWGIMLTNALPDATSNSAASYVWWWFLPPGIAIASLSLAFVLVGFALDSIFNPRLRAR